MRQTIQMCIVLQPFKVLMIQGKVQTSQKRKVSLVVNRETNTSTKSTLFESVKGIFTNFSYGLGGLKTTYFHQENRKVETKSYVLGSQVQSELSLKAHQGLIWLTYRKNISIAPNIHSDLGWGCLIRVAQMAWAHALQRHFSQQQKNVEKHYIITPFLEEKGAQFKYSLYRFVQMGKKLWLLQPGQWYSMTQVSTVLEALQQQSPLKGSEHLVIKVFNETINIKMLLQVFGTNACCCVLKKADCYLCNQPKKYFKQPYFQSHNGAFTKTQMNSFSSQSKKGIFLIVTTKLGRGIISKENYAFLLQLMSLPIFSGCLGGVPQKARFLTGRHQQRISYLDPHYVRQVIDPMNLPKNLQKFQCKEVRYMNRQQLDPEMAFCFFMTGPSDLQILIEAIDRIQKKEAFLRYQWDTVDEFEILSCADKECKRLGLKEKFEDYEESTSDFNRNSSMDSSFLFQ